MPSPTLSATDLSPADLSADVLVVGVAASAEGPRLADEASLGEASLSTDELVALGVTGAVDTTQRLAAPRGVSARSLLLVGLGAAEPTSDTLRSAAGSAARAASDAARLAFALPTATPEDVQAVLEGAALGGYKYVPRSAPGAASAVAEVTIATRVPGAHEAAERAAITSQAVTIVRDLVNEPPNTLYPASFVERARELTAELDLELEEWGVDELREGGYGGILGVGQGSSRPPRLLAVRYRAEEDAPHLALVGKGITFDSGGLSLKPAASMVGMKYDMTGAATVLATIIAVARLDLPLRMTAWLCLAENLPSSTAIRPNDVLTIRGGRTVEVLNTDAEGRLVLADGIVRASEEHPDAIIDVATLTGAARVALGERYSAVMGDDALVERVRSAATSTGELVWPMPLPAELRALLATEVADIANAKPGSTAAGMLLAGVFLREFVGRASDDDEAPSIPWAHLDIAGAANNGSGAYGFTPKGPSGVTVRLLIALAESYAAK
ncbi:MAG: leucyl aminopeptidase [Microcella sp.]|uniref:leucyl aminopeptidase n=1 Tax=Microcella sp. TaxID=1913979 RepID=UPI0033149C29